MDTPARTDTPNPARELEGRNSTRRQQVIDAAAATFSRLGYHGASTRAIADTLGIKVASLYFHIASKEDALEEICSLGMRRGLMYLEKAVEEGTDLSDQVRHFFRHQRDDFIAYADYVSVSIHEGRYLPLEAKARTGLLSRELRARLDKMFHDAAIRGELNSNVTPRQARFVIIATMRSMSELYVGGRVADLDQIIAGWVEVIIRGLVTDYRAPMPMDVAPGSSASA